MHVGNGLCEFIQENVSWCLDSLLLAKYGMVILGVSKFSDILLFVPYQMLVFSLLYASNSESGIVQV